MDGKVVVITGANSGIGFEASRMLAGRGAHVVMACRDEGRMGASLTSLRALVPGAKVDGLVLDLASLGSIERASNELANSHQHIDVLVNNAPRLTVSNCSSARIISDISRSVVASCLCLITPMADGS
jgi:NAD(P)-dependent dehydrogenase (short-subunit alcohol dehydrogenase family)